MNLTAGTKVPPYEIINLLGAGDMGEVYRARDSRHVCSDRIEIKIGFPRSSYPNSCCQTFNRFD
jgi:serine/threonine protein kinase